MFNKDIKFSDDFIEAVFYNFYCPVSVGKCGARLEIIKYGIAEGACLMQFMYKDCMTRNGLAFDDGDNVTYVL